MKLEIDDADRYEILRCVQERWANVLGWAMMEEKYGHPIEAQRWYNMSHTLERYAEKLNGGEDETGT